VRRDCHLTRVVTLLNRSPKAKRPSKKIPRSSTPLDSGCAFLSRQISSDCDKRLSIVGCRENTNHVPTVRPADANHDHAGHLGDVERISDITDGNQMAPSQSLNEVVAGPKSGSSIQGRARQSSRTNGCGVPGRRRYQRSFRCLGVDIGIQRFIQNPTVSRLIYDRPVSAAHAAATSPNSLNKKTGDAGERPSNLRHHDSGQNRPH